MTISPGLRAAVEYLAAAQTDEEKNEAQDFFDRVSKTDPLGTVALATMYMKWSAK